MRWGFIFCFLFFAYFIFVRTAVAATADTTSASCKVETNDIGVITGYGTSTDTAFEDAATKCFDRRNQLYRAKHGGRGPDTETGEIYIDICANIKCG